MGGRDGLVWGEGERGREWVFFLLSREFIVYATLFVAQEASPRRVTAGRGSNPPIRSTIADYLSCRSQVA